MLWRLRASTTCMRRIAATTALLALAWLLVRPGALLAKPTRTPSRPASRLLAAPSALRSSRDRSPHQAAAARRPSKPEPRATSRATSRAAAAAASRRHPAASARLTPAASRAAARHAAAEPPVSPATARHVHAWERSQRDAAARAAILAADRAADHAPDRPAPRSRAAALHTAPAPDDSLAETFTSADTSFAATAALPPMRSIEEEASTPVFLPSLRVSSLYDAHGRLIVPAPLRGSREILLHQNQMADQDGLDRVRDDADLLDMLRQKKLVALPANSTLLVDQRLPDNRRYSRPWTAEFLAVLSHDFYASFHQPLQITSAVRTVAVQQRLVRTNGNAAPASGEDASPHLTGQAVDIAKKGLSVTEIAWMRTYLSPLIDSGKIDVEEEFQQSCFHISVYKNFLPALQHATIATAPQLPREPLSERPSY